MRAARKHRKPANARGRKRASKTARKPAGRTAAKRPEKAARKTAGRPARSSKAIVGVRAKAKSKNTGKAKRKVGASAGAHPSALRGTASGNKARVSTRAAKPATRAARSKVDVPSRAPRVLPAAEAPARIRKPSHPLVEATPSTADQGAPVVDRPTTPPPAGAGSTTESGVPPGLPVPIASFTI